MTNSREEKHKSAREVILETAADLFFRQGFRAVGVDTIIEQADVAKMTLYRHFPSKDALIVTYLQDSNLKFWEWFDAAADPHEQPRDQLLAVFQALEKLVTSPTCYGCPFLMAATEFPEPAHPGHRIALEHKQGLRQRLYTMVKQAGAREPESLASHLYLLMDGAFMAVRIFGPDNPALRVAEAVERLLDCHLG